ncbi:hypothetical protein Taro_010435 [Colocasia esculenta]|uniref:Protein kinase domain-containing protein n=1 Tax=Colocasia esculenta TaxID=4460 RepID=A0A843TYU7_COLES|nr:hypothetical protein [Colocasia esculenta]
MLRSGGNRMPAVAPPIQLVVVAVDADKSSQHALKWAADHLVTRGQIFLLLHVRRKIISTSANPYGMQLPVLEEGANSTPTIVEDIDMQTKEILLPFQCFCSRRGLQCKEVIVEETDVPKGIINFVMDQCVDILVLGATSRNLLMRTFKTDVSSAVSKAAPDFCSVYVISKGKISLARPASNPNKYPKARQFELFGSQFQSVKSEPDIGQRMDASVRSKMAVGAKKKMGPNKDLRSSEVSYDSSTDDSSSTSSQPAIYSYQSTASCPSPTMMSVDRLANSCPRDYTDSSRQSRLSQSQTENTYSNEQTKCLEMNRDGTTIWSGGYSPSAYERSTKGLEMNRDGTTIWSGGHSPSGFERSSAFSQEYDKASWSNKSMEDIESDMRRLKLELAQTMDMYSNACRELISAKQQVHAQMIDRNVRSGEGQLAEQESIELAEKEKERCKVLLEAAQAAQRQKIIEIEEKRAPGDRKMLQDMVQKKKVLEGLTTNVYYRKYTIEEIQQATDNFSDKLKIGEGGYGPVFKASLDHTAVAIKILRPDAAQGARQFQQEIEVLSSIRHPNMVLLMGACPEYGCIVYEYMANGSLEDRLFCRSNTPPLPWQLRFKIAAELATGLLFLHQSKPEPLVHRDLKPANILLDHNFVSKIADVGLARLVPSSVANAATQYCVTAAAGTFCYIDPEYQQTGMLGIKSDIYALGIILLQVVTGAQPMGLAHNVERAMEEGRFQRLLDPKVSDWPIEETLAFAKIGLKCAELRKKDRPDLATVVLPELHRLREFAEGSRSSQSDSLLHSRSTRSSQGAANLPPAGGSGLVGYGVRK